MVKPRTRDRTNQGVEGREDARKCGRTPSIEQDIGSEFRASREGSALDAAFKERKIKETISSMSSSGSNI